jgi:hypothetical protein
LLIISLEYSIYYHQRQKDDYFALIKRVMS